MTAMAHPRTIHDFYDFSDELLAFDYPAPGAPEVVRTLVGWIGLVASVPLTTALAARIVTHREAGPAPDAAAVDEGAAPAADERAVAAEDGKTPSAPMH